MTQYLSKAEAERLMVESNGNVDELTSNIRSPKYEELRKKLLQTHRFILHKYYNYRGDIQNKIDIREYKYDLLFGLELYSILNNAFQDEESGIPWVREFSSDEFWIYLSVITIPDIVAERWGFDNQNRFLGSRNRIWLSTLWWYVHLSWQGDKEVTYKTLKDMTTDTILNLVDRTGREGYNIEFYRVLMKEYSKVKLDRQSFGRIFRKIMVTNQLSIQTMNPSLHLGGELLYVKELFKKVGLVESNGVYKLRSDNDHGTRFSE